MSDPLSSAIESSNDDRQNVLLFYDQGTMPCCDKPIKYYPGPKGGDCTNIKCFHCGSKWNICPRARYIERI